MFSFSPVQEFIKSSRKLLDFWSGSYRLHYLSPKACWFLAERYGPNALITPNLYNQTPDFELYFEEFGIAKPIGTEGQPSPSLVTAGFPNVITALIPAEDKDTIGKELQDHLWETWLNLGKKVREAIKSRVQSCYEDSRWVAHIAAWIGTQFPGAEQEEYELPRAIERWGSYFSLGISGKSRFPSGSKPKLHGSWFYRINTAKPSLKGAVATSQGEA